MAKNFKDVQMGYIEDDIEKIQTKTNFYLVQLGNGGCNHIAREIIQNAFDECMDMNSPGKNIEIRYDKITGEMRVTDDGRGFPEDNYPLEIFFTKQFSGSKSTRSQSGGTAGEFGVGSTVTNALSSEFEVISYRIKENTVHRILFVNGKKVEDSITKNKNKVSGTTIRFIPNEYYLGNGSHIDIDEMIKWLEDILHLLNSSKNIKVVVKVIDENGTPRTIKLKQSPFYEMIDKFTRKAMFTPVVLDLKSKYNEPTVIDGKSVDVVKDVNLQVAFTYDSDKDLSTNTITKSFCNLAETIEGGYHVDVSLDAICRYLQYETKKSLSDREREKIDILWQDVKMDMRLFVNLSSNAMVGFVGNAKVKISNDAIIPTIREMITKGIKDYFSNNQSTLQSMCKLIKNNAKIRIEVNERKSKTIKMKTNSFEDRLSDNYTPANNTGKHDYRELYIVEGQKSALGSIIDGRNPDVQAVMGVRGMTLNAYKNTINKIMQNNEYSTLFKAIKYDPRNGNMDNFYFDKIIIATDADTDGGGIMGGLAGLFLLVGKPIVESGRLYRVLPPLYRIKNSGKKYAMDKSDLLQIYKENVVDSVNVYNKDGEKLSKKELSQFITDIENYLDTIEYIAEHTSVDYRLIEMVGYIVTMSACGKIISEDSSNREFINGAIINDKKKLKSAIDSLFDNPKWVDNLMMTLNKKFPELRIEGRHISGPLYGRYQALNISVPFIRRFKSLIDIFIIYGINLSWSDKKSKKDKTYGTIAEFCNAMSKYNATIQTRFKGLGEAQYDEISETIMDPRKRRLVRLTITDLEEDLRKMRILHDDSQEYRVLRKQLMADYDVNPDEIDT